MHKTIEAFLTIVREAFLRFCHSNWVTGDKRRSTVVGCRKRPLPAIDFRQRSFHMSSGCISDFPSAFAMSKICWLNVVSMFLTRRRGVVL